MRLIDADALIHTHESEVAIIGKDWTVGDLAAAIETAPTIDAIPVEWIQAQIENEKRAPLFRRYADALLTIWQREQEAQDE